MGKIGLSGEELAILSKLSTEELRLLAALRTSGKSYDVLNTLVQLVIDIEKNYAFALNEDEKLAQNHAYSRGKAAFGTQFLHLISGAGFELARREKIQQELRVKQGATHE